MTSREIAERYFPVGRKQLQPDEITMDDHIKLTADIDAAIAEAVRAALDECIRIVALAGTSFSEYETATRADMIMRITNDILARSALYQPQADAANPLFEGR